MNLIAMQNQCVPPVGESRSDLEFIFDLARRLGMGDDFPWEKITDAFDWEMGANGISVAWLREHPGGYLRAYGRGTIPEYEKDEFPTPPGKIDSCAPGWLKAI